MGLIHISGQVKLGMYLRVSLGKENIHFPYFGRRNDVQNDFYM